MGAPRQSSTQWASWSPSCLYERTSRTKERTLVAGRMLPDGNLFGGIRVIVVVHLLSLCQKHGFDLHGDSNLKFYHVRSPSDRVAIAAIAILILVIAGWMFWTVETFADGDTWWDFWLKLVLHDLVFTIMVFGSALVAHACFPERTRQFAERATAKLSIVLSVIMVLVYTTVFFVSLVLPVLMYLGIVE